jgi:kynurenine formamidase
VTRGESEVVDLTMRLDGDTPVYPGDPVVRVEVAAGFDDAGYFNTRLALGSHNGTHIDAEGHMIPGGRMLDGYPIDRFRGRGVLLDVRGGASAAPEADGFDLVDGLDGAGADAGCIVLLWTGISDSRSESGYYSRVPRLPDGLVEQLIARGVGMVGVDAGSIDDEPFSVHKALLGHGILIAENLVGLSALAARLRSAADDRARRFTVWALPLNVAVEASPARVVAVFDD